MKIIMMCRICGLPIRKANSGYEVAPTTFAVMPTAPHEHEPITMEGVGDSEQEMIHDHAAFGHSAISMAYDDGGQDVRFGVREGADMNKCDCTVYFCKHRVEHPDGLPMDWSKSPCQQCRQEYKQMSLEALRIGERVALHLEPGYFKIRSQEVKL